MGAVLLLHFLRLLFWKFEMRFPIHDVIYGCPNNIFVLYSLYFNDIDIIYFYYLRIQ